MSIDRSRDYDVAGNLRFIYDIGEGKGSGAIDLKDRTAIVGFRSVVVGIRAEVAVVEGRAEGGSQLIIIGRVDSGERGTVEESAVTDRGKGRSVRKGNRGERSATSKSVPADRGYRGRDFNRGKREAMVKSSLSDRSKGRRKRN